MLSGSLTLHYTGSLHTMWKLYKLLKHSIEKSNESLEIWQQEHDCNSKVIKNPAVLLPPAFDCMPHKVKMFSIYQ